MGKKAVTPVASSFFGNDPQATGKIIAGRGKVDAPAAIHLQVDESRREDPALAVNNLIGHLTLPEERLRVVDDTILDPQILARAQRAATQ